jgi:hypothetical protein
MWLGIPPPLRLRSRCFRGPASCARNILRKLQEKGERQPDFAAELTRAELDRQLASEDF